MAPWKKLLGAGAGVGTIGLAGLAAFLRDPGHTVVAKTDLEKSWKTRTEQPISSDMIPSRFDTLKTTRSTEEFDVVVIGGGATGVSLALDATTRGLKVLCVERDDFASGTSSRSTKLIHGGVRYLERAFLNVDPGEYELVKEAVAERRHLIKVTPHLSEPLPLVLPLYSRDIWGWWDVIKFWFGLKIYDRVSGLANMIQPSYQLPSQTTKQLFPQIDPKQLICSYVYFDGVHNDARMCLYMALTASIFGAQMLNHVEATGFEKNEKGRITGVTVRDRITKEEFSVKAKSVVNATGPYSDAVLKMDDAKMEDVIVPAAGVHIVLPHTKFSDTHGLLIPRTEDGRVAFMLPWEGSAIAGTTDSLVEVSESPEPTLDAVESIVKELSKYLTEPITMKDLDAVWTGIRPLAKFHSTGKSSTQAISRSHTINVNDDSGLVTIAGGKWTTCRNMAEETLDEVLRQVPELGEKATPCVTPFVTLYGSGGWNSRTRATLERHNIDEKTASHLSRNYGDKARMVGDLILDGHGKLLAGGYPFTEAEVLHQVRNEYACTAVDVLARRTRLAFLNKFSAEYALPRVIEMMSSELNWDAQRRWKEFVDAERFLQTMHISDEGRWGHSRQGSSKKGQIIDKVLGKSSCLSKDEIKFVMDCFEEEHSKTGNLLARIDVAQALNVAEKIKQKFRYDISSLLEHRDKIGYLGLLTTFAYQKNFC